IVEKTKDGAGYHRLEPEPERDLRPRQRTVAALRKLEEVVARAEVKRAEAEEEERGEDEPELLTARELRSVADALDVETAQLADTVRARLDEVKSRLE